MMKSTILATALAAFVVPAFAAPVVGKPAPAFELADSNGTKHALEQYKGRVIVLEWNNPECPFVRKHYGAKNMQKQQAEATAAGVVWLTINSGAEGKQGHLDPAGANAYLAAEGAKPTAYLFDGDGTVGRAYGARTTPQIAIIDKDGMLRYQGGIDSIASADVEDIARAVQYVPQVLSELAAGKDVSVTSSEPYGCSVKYGG